MNEEQSKIQNPESKIGLALSAGAAKGLAHIGVLKALTGNGISIDAIAGTSAGAIIGGAVASGLSPAQIAEMAAKARWLSLGRFGFSRFGLLSNAPMKKYIEQNFVTTKFEEMRIPFACVATDLASGDKVILQKNGDAATAICASCAVPGMFVPVTIDNRKLIDGGIVEFTPTNTVRTLGANFVIAVDVLADDSRVFSTPQTGLGVFFQSAFLLLKTAASFQHNYADIVIRPKVGHLRADEVGRAKEFIEAGEAATLEVIDEIKRLSQLNKGV
ncbi:MAG: patatin-like phospholipase family protein [Pyrinomonadaceae bacterium]|nr:patatin-like phospholipase family protein [Pyrinomonadaceae bacterium]